MGYNTNQIGYIIHWSMKRSIHVGRFTGSSQIVLGIILIIVGAVLKLGILQFLLDVAGIVFIIAGIVFGLLGVIGLFKNKD